MCLYERQKYIDFWAEIKTDREKKNRSKLRIWVLRITCTVWMSAGWVFAFFFLHMWLAFVLLTQSVGHIFFNWLTKWAANNRRHNFFFCLTEKRNSTTFEHYMPHSCRCLHQKSFITIFFVLQKKKKKNIPTIRIIIVSVKFSDWLRMRMGTYVYDAYIWNFG